MQNIVQLSRFFHPVQPRFREGGDAVTYKEILADASLSGWICCYWQLKSNKPFPKGFSYAAVADGCIDFFFDLNEPHENFVMGFSSGYTSFVLPTDFNYAGIRFFPGAFAGIYNIKASELKNQCQYISDVIPREHEKLKRLLIEQHNIENIKPLFDNYFKKHIFSKYTAIDSRFVESLATILTSAGPLNITKDVPTRVSARHVRRLFDFYIGAAPKEFNKIVRFQKLLSKNVAGPCIRKEKLYYDAGYYDQSHFIKDFKALYGTAPLKAFKETLYRL